MNLRASFSNMKDSTREDWQLIGQEFVPYAKALPDRIMAHLKILEGDYGGFPVDRHTPSPQTGTNGPPRRGRARHRNTPDTPGGGAPFRANRPRNARPGTGGLASGAQPKTRGGIVYLTAPSPDRGAGDPLEVKAAVVELVVILAGEERVDERLGDLLVRDRLAPLLGELAEQRAVGRIDARHRGGVRRVRAEIARGRRAQREVPVEDASDDCRDSDRDEHRDAV